MESVLSFMAALATPGISNDIRNFTSMPTHRSTSTGSCSVAFSLKIRALPVLLSWERMTVEPSVCLRGKLARLLSITSCDGESEIGISLDWAGTSKDVRGTHNELATDTIWERRESPNIP